ncbi:unnamed protein product [Mytilus coruscus]|uniref:CCHC-type domain-containing protein n=1 Tax=Mytilus coruscus TaxID=42192 RepID=A0A6J8BHI1_MYTCO|nr:unnamed protein product [Mytilus coruscus]
MIDADEQDDCQQMNSIIDRLAKTESNRGPNQSQKTDFLCYFCGKGGHNKRDCRKFLDMQKNGKYLSNDRFQTSNGHRVTRQKTIKIKGIFVNCLLDTSSTLTVIHVREFSSIPESQRPDKMYKRLATEETTVLPPRSEVLIFSKVVGDSSNVVQATVEPVHTKVDLLVARYLVDPSQGRIPLRIVNTNRVLHHNRLKSFFVNFKNWLLKNEDDLDKGCPGDAAAEHEIDIEKKKTERVQERLSHPNVTVPIIKTVTLQYKSCCI